MPLDTAESVYGPVAALRGGVLPSGRGAEYALNARRKSVLALEWAGEIVPEELVEPSSPDIAGAPVFVTVNHGRWVVNCPGNDGVAGGNRCGGAQIAARDDHRFFCVTCGNAFIGGRWLAVTWPDDADAIAAALSVRPVSYRNWSGEPVTDLLADNADPINGLA